jgi:hypothetical protein
MQFVFWNGASELQPLLPLSEQYFSPEKALYLITDMQLSFPVTLQDKV